MEPGGRHEVRICAKKLRYAAEFFAGLVKDEGARKRQHKFAARLARLQDGLGALNDLRIGDNFAERLSAAAGASDPPLAIAAGRVAGDVDEHEAALLKAAVRAHRRFRQSEPFWR